MTAQPGERRRALRKSVVAGKASVGVAVGAAAAAAAVAAVALAPEAGTSSSHREAPLIAEDPSADNTDLYAFRSPDKPDTVTIVSNWIPGEDPAAGPNYYTFSPSARYNIYVDRTGDARPDLTYRFRFARTAGAAFLGNTVQAYTVTLNGKVLARGNDAAEQHRPSLDAELPHLAAKARCIRRVGRRSSPVNVTMRSSATSGRSSTCSRSGRAPAPRAAARTSSPATRCIRSRCRSRSRS